MAGRTKGGIYYKGSLLSVRAPPPAGAALEEHARFDPWESIVVEWDAAGRDEEFIQVHRNTSHPGQTPVVRPQHHSFVSSCIEGLQREKLPRTAMGPAAGNAGCDPFRDRARSGGGSAPGGERPA